MREKLSSKGRKIMRSSLLKLAFIIGLATYLASCSQKGEVPQFVADLFIQAKNSPIGCIEIQDVILNERQLGDFYLCHKRP